MKMEKLVAVSQNGFTGLLAPDVENDFLKIWLDMYFEIEVTTRPNSRKVQRRDLDLFISFLLQEFGTDYRLKWTPRTAAGFKKYLQTVVDANGKRRWSDKTVNRIIAHVKTFSKWVHKIVPFPLGDPMLKIKTVAVGNSLEVERALTPAERRQILRAADELPGGGRSKDLNRYKKEEKKPQRKGYRPYRNRAIVYTLIETGMRRKAVADINLHDIKFDQAIITVEEKGGVQVDYNISDAGLKAIQEYIDTEREADQEYWNSPVLFLPERSRKNAKGRLSEWSINQIWNTLCRNLEITKTPHSARHAMGKFIMEKTGNIAAVQRQLGHKNPIYSMQYSRTTNQELSKLLNDREL